MVAQFREMPPVRLQPRVSKPSARRLPTVSSCVFMLYRHRIVFSLYEVPQTIIYRSVVSFFGLALEGSV